MTEIKPINKSTVHQICSGQVVLDLATAVKELVENSLDAKATTIEVKLKEYGSEVVEVSDNGIGVEENNFAALTLKHYTSKLKEFVDLNSIGTFGFRGEALSSLCALCDVSISTRHKDASIGHKLDYDYNGKILKTTQVARQVGTTVQLKNIFSTLPVRCKEFNRNIKKEYTKLLHLLNAYCMISTNVRISCSNQTSRGRKSVIVSTKAAASIRQNIITLFGSKQFEVLTEFAQVEPTPEVCEDFHLKEVEVDGLCKHVSINGWISFIGHTHGRSSPDRQYYFINSRPVDFSRLSKLVNEVYHLFNRHQYPFVALNIGMKRDAVDVNVTPDKRQVFLQGEKVLLAIVKCSLLRMYERGGCHTVDACPRPNTDQQKNSRVEKPNNITASSTQDQTKPSECSTPSSSSLLSRLRRNESPAQDFISRKRSSIHCHSTPAPVAKQPRMDTFFSPRFNQSASLDSDNDEVVCRMPDDVNITSIKRPLADNAKVELTKADATEVSDDISVENSHQSNDFDHLKLKTISRNCAESNCVPGDPQVNVVYDKADSADSGCSVQSVQFSLTTLTQRLRVIKDLQTRNQLETCSGFQAKIAPGQNSDAEKELSRNLNKSAFLEMAPLGQFNLGFVVARHKNDLFIIDQHASDEIYNFETLQRSDIHTQLLVVPQRLNLIAADKLVLLENLHVFKRNGFDFRVEQDQDSGLEIVSLTRVPMSKNWDFGSSDVDELIFMLSDAPGVFCRPSRVRQMFASRACRKSVMIGTALDVREMRKLLDHMADIHHPWNCPHGRPTMRHLLDLSRISSA